LCRDGLFWGGVVPGWLLNDTVKGKWADARKWMSLGCKRFGVIMGPSRAESSSAVKDRGLGNIARKYR
jgi:hypothetical protein